MSLDNDPRIPSVFGELNTSVQQLSMRLDNLLARDPAREFGKTEGNVGRDDKNVVFSEVDTYTKVFPSTAVPFTDEIFGTQIYSKQIQLNWIGWSTNIGGTPFFRGLLLEFFNQPPQNNVLPARPHGQMFVPFEIYSFPSSFVPATGVYTTSMEYKINRRIAVDFRWIRVGVYDALTGLKLATNVSVYFTTTPTIFSLSFIGD